jgi:hypothetical protein
MTRKTLDTHEGAGTRNISPERHHDAHSPNSNYQMLQPVQAVTLGINNRNKDQPSVRLSQSLGLEGIVPKTPTEMLQVASIEQDQNYPANRGSMNSIQSQQDSLPRK